ncbi:hypothetical protein GIB67_012798 [Kingdonia uniflora]|uniref:Uncharacterized protein n=1 Tax=Kingdonia uniflora TaxID=39325 RepID=A0A7J7NF98_9MAGN|nr:hypothetical protein GIB67_012798 [Kingdonia uniflora]
MAYNCANCAPMHSTDSIGIIQLEAVYHGLKAATQLNYLDIEILNDLLYAIQILKKNWAPPWKAVYLKRDMSQTGLIYSFVAKGTVVLAEYTSFSGNFSTIAVQCLQNLPANSHRHTYSCDGHTFNFMIDSGFVFLVVAGETVGRSLPFTFLERVKDDFKQRYGASIASGGPHPLADEDDDDLFEDNFSVAYSLDREFGPKLKEHMEYCISHPEETSKISKLKAQMTEVKGIMMDNIEKVLDRGEKIELLVDKTESLQFQADSFQRQGRQLRRKMWLQSLKLKLMVGGGIIAVVIILWLMVCRGFKC